MASDAPPTSPRSSSTDSAVRKDVPTSGSESDKLNQHELDRIDAGKRDLSNQAYDLMSGKQPSAATEAANPANSVSKHETDKNDSIAKSLIPELKLIHPGDTVRETVNLDGKERDFFLHVPKDYDASKPTPLLLVFNGYSDKPGQGGAAAGGAGMEQITGLSQKSDEKNFLVAYMDGNPKDKFSWNNGEGWFSKQDDIKLTQNIMSAIKQDFNVDESRQYLSGLSQGGSFAHRVANEMPGKFAAIATVSTWMTGLEKPHYDDMSVLNIHSKDDSTVPFEGRTWMPFAPEMQSQHHIGDYYQNMNQMEQESKSSSFVGANGKPVDVLSTVNPSTNAEIKQVFLHDEGHLWFGGSGDEKSAVNATDMVVDFLLSHSRNKTDKTN